MIKASAPGRAGIIGNPTDMYGGNVISCSIGERATCRLTSSPGLVISMDGEEADLSMNGGLALHGDKFDIARAALNAFEIDPHEAALSMELSTDIPEQAGLAGSTALLTAVVGSISAYLGLDLNKYELAEAIRQVEAEVMKITCGYQDQYMAVFGGLNYMDFRGKEQLCPSHFEPFATVEPLADSLEALPMLLAHTGVKRNSGGVHRSLRDRWLDGEKDVVEGYEKIAELGRIGKKALLEEDWETLGRLMNENHAIQRDLGGSGESNEVLIKAALDNGAYGAKLAGAGNGGTIITLTKDPKKMAQVLLDAGAERILSLRPGDGLVVEREW